MKIYLLDRNADITDCWRLYFAGAADVRAVQDDFAHFMDTHPDVDCVVSPANSYGLMDGGYDAAIAAYFGEELIPHVQAHIREHFACEQPVGTSFITDIPGSRIRLIHTPTMRVPSVIREPLVVYQCMRTTLLCARQNGVRAVVIPAFGGSCGRVPARDLALLMRAAYDQLREPPAAMDWNYAASRHLERIGAGIFVCAFPPDAIAAHPALAVPHAYVQGADGRLISRFRLDSAEPPEASGLRPLFSTDPPLGDAAERIARWLREKPRRFCGENNRTNWDAMRASFRDMSEAGAQIARALAEGTLIADRAEYEAGKGGAQ